MSSSSLVSFSPRSPDPSDETSVHAMQRDRRRRWARTRPIDCALRSMPFLQRVNQRDQFADRCSNSHACSDTCYLPMYANDVNGPIKPQAT